MARILVIDDDESLLKMMSLMLNRAGHETILATSGQQGIQIAQRERPDLAIVDVMMPGLNGYDVCRYLREDPQTMDIPLLILTALAQTEQRHEAQRSGADDFVTKPITRDDLIYHVTTLLQTGARNVPEPEDALPPPPSHQPDIYAQPAAPDMPQPFDHLLPIVAVMGLGAGVGATTVAVNLSLGLLSLGRSCIVELSGIGAQATAHLRVTPRATWQQIANIPSGSSKRQIGEALTIGHSSGVALMAAPHNSGPGFSPESLTYTLNVLCEGFKRVVLDLPSLLTPATIASLKSARNVVLVLGDNPSALGVAREMSETIQMLGPQGQLHIVMNRTRPHGVAYEDAVHALNYPISLDIPYEAMQIRALQMGVPLVMSQPGSLFARTITYLARQL
ncbi:MAG: response regulator [Anaerolineae bacterium]|nr:response regulator [Anaerolineae bacterium]